MHTVKRLPFRKELHLRLSRMDIDIHTLKRHLQMQHTGGKPPHHELISIRFLQGRLEELGLFSGVGGDITLDENGDAIKSIVFNTYVDGQVKWAETLDAEGKVVASAE